MTATVVIAGSGRGRDRGDGGDTTGPSQVAGAADAADAGLLSDQGSVTGLAVALLVLTLALHATAGRRRAAPAGRGD